MLNMLNVTQLENISTYLVFQIRKPNWSLKGFFTDTSVSINGVEVISYIEANHCHLGLHMMKDSYPT